MLFAGLNVLYRKCVTDERRCAAMTGQTVVIDNRPCRVYGDAKAEYLLLQMTDAHELQSMDDEIAAIAQDAARPLFVCCCAGAELEQ